MVWIAALASCFGEHSPAEFALGRPQYRCIYPHCSKRLAGCFDRGSKCSRGKEKGSLLRLSKE
jgi:hypothetical protein